MLAASASAIYSVRVHRVRVVHECARDAPPHYVLVLSRWDMAVAAERVAVEPRECFSALVQWRDAAVANFTESAEYR